MTDKFFSDEAEASVIGGFVVDCKHGVMCISSKGIKSLHFFHPIYRKLFVSIERLIANGKPVDTRILIDDLKGEAPPPSESWNDVICRCVDLTPTTAHLEYYCDIVIRNWQARETRAILTGSTEDLMEGADVGSVLTSVQSSLMSISAIRETRTKADILKAKGDMWRAAREGKLIGIPSPWPRFDAATGGPRRGHVCVFASKKGLGKSTLVANWMLHLGQAGIPCCDMAFEDGMEITWGRIASNFGAFSAWLLDVGKGDNQMIDTGLTNLELVMRLPIHIEERRMDIRQIDAYATTMKIRHDIQALFIDGVKDVGRTGRDDVMEDNMISAGLCNLARRLNISVIAVHHIKKREDKNADFDIDDIRGSARIVDDARMVLFLQPPNGTKPYRLHCIRNNNGPTGTVPLDFMFNICRFAEQPAVPK